MTQLEFADFAPQIVWLAITFVILYLVMARVALPGIAKVMDDRERRIQDDLDRAEKLKNEAEGVLQAYDQAIAAAREAAQGEIQRAAAEMAAIAATREAEVAEAMAAKTAAAERAIASATATALGEIQGVAAEAAQDAAARLAGLSLSSAQARAAVESLGGGRD